MIIGRVLLSILTLISNALLVPVQAPLLDPNGIVVRGPLHLLSLDKGNFIFGDGPTYGTIGVAISIEQYPKDELAQLWLGAVKEPKAFRFAGYNPSLKRGDPVSA